METVNVLAFSGGKDSTAMWLHSIENDVKVMPVFCDTGNEHELTYSYIDYLESQLGPVRRIKADFAKQIEHKKLHVIDKWPAFLMLDVEGHWHTDEENESPAPTWEPADREATGIVSDGWEWVPFQRGLTEEEAAAVVETARSVLIPTGNPFLDLCIWKGRFPSRKRQFCTVELKVRPTFDQVYLPLLETGHHVVSWQGVRAQESKPRAKLPEREMNPEGYETYRPILQWKVEDVFAIHRKHGIEPNPLYKLGMGRVGCMPCINARKDEIFEIWRRFPKEVERIAEWESIVKMASRRQGASFFPSANGHGASIMEEVEWSMTTRGGRQLDLLKTLALEEAETEIACSSQYGLCE